MQESKHNKQKKYKMKRNTKNLNILKHLKRANTTINTISVVAVLSVFMTSTLLIRYPIMVCMFRDVIVTYADIPIICIWPMLVYLLCELLFYMHKHSISYLTEPAQIWVNRLCKSRAKSNIFGTTLVPRTIL